MGDLLQKIIGAAMTKRGGVALLLGLACAAVGGGAVAHDSPEGQAAGGAAGVVVALAVVALGPKAMAFARARGWLGGENPPAGPAP
jgi:hypothetical protein